MRYFRFALCILLFAILIVSAARVAAQRVGSGPADPLPAPAGATPGRVYFAETGHYLGGGFLEFWRGNNGGFLLGLPLTEEFVENGLMVQYFERGRMEYHPDYPPGRRVALSLLGAILNPNAAFPKPDAFTSNQGHVYFPETGYSLYGGFLQFWRANGGLRMFGFPLSQEVRGDDGRTRQLFERAVFVLYPEFSGTPYLVIPEPLGYSALKASGQRLPLAAYVELLPPQLPEARTLLIRVHDQGGAQVRGDWDGRAIGFTDLGAGIYAGLTGERPLGATGKHTLSIAVQRGGEQRTLRRTVEVVPGSFPVNRVVLDAERSQLLDPAITTSEQERINRIFAGFSGPPKWSGPFRLPVPEPLRITAAFGARRAYNQGPVASVHGGLDVAVDEGTPVRAPAQGTVVLAEPLQVRGTAVILDHGAGVYTLYGHLSRLMVRAGQEVAAGELLAYSGNTGLSSGPHLHWELHVAGPGVDPLEWTTRSLP